MDTAREHPPSVVSSPKTLPHVFPCQHLPLPPLPAGLSVLLASAPPAARATHSPALPWQVGRLPLVGRSLLASLSVLSRWALDLSLCPGPEALRVQEAHRHLCRRLQAVRLQQVRVLRLGAPAPR
jgi:hypothetical protein